jgi:hypothetical protein
MTRGRAQFRGILWGGILLAAGTWFLLQRLGIELPNFFSALWPLFPFMFGAAFLVTFFAGEGRDCGLVWPGTFGILLGSFFFLFSFGVFEWEQMSELWPVFPLIVGLSFLATWIVGRGKDTGLLVPALIMLSVGTLGLGFELGVIDARTVGLLWPLALVLLGGLLIFRSLRRSPLPTGGDLNALGDRLERKRSRLFGRSSRREE